MDTIFWLLITAGTLCMFAWFILAVRQNIHANRKITQRDLTVAIEGRTDLTRPEKSERIAAANRRIADETRAMTTLGTWEILLFVAALVFYGINIVRLVTTGV